MQDTTPRLTYAPSCRSLTAFARRGKPAVGLLHRGRHQLLINLAGTKHPCHGPPCQVPEALDWLDFQET